MKSTPEMRESVRELATPPRDDFDLAVLAVLDDFDVAISAVSIAEEATRKALESIPTAMDAAVEKEREASGKRVAELESLLAKATCFDVGCVSVESRGNGLWVVTDCCCVYGEDGELEFEPLPSSQSEAFIARTRFQFDEAMKRAEEIAKKDCRDA